MPSVDIVLIDIHIESDLSVRLRTQSKLSVRLNHKTSFCCKQKEYSGCNISQNMTDRYHKPRKELRGPSLEIRCFLLIITHFFISSQNRQTIEGLSGFINKSCIIMDRGRDSPSLVMHQLRLISSAELNERALRAFF
jgi:hypothetical protein